MSDAMSDERIAECAAFENANRLTGNTSTADVIRDLLAEVKRVRRNNEIMLEAEIRPSDIHRRRADRAEAALARVNAVLDETGRMYVEGIAVGKMVSLIREAANSTEGPSA